MFPAHYTWKLAEKGFKMAFMMNILAIINSCEIILEIFFAKNHCEIQVHTILVRALYSIKYSNKVIIKSS
jgi:hypothetical protein